MNKLTKYTLLVVALLLLLGIAGRCDYNESVICLEWFGTGTKNNPIKIRTRKRI